MRRLPRATFAPLLSLLPAIAAAIGFLVLDQVPTKAVLLGSAPVIGGVALHHAASE
jgi:inner membrane transporter RhtA